MYHSRPNKRFERDHQGVRLPDDELTTMVLRLQPQIADFFTGRKVLPENGCHMDGVWLPYVVGQN